MMPICCFLGYLFLVLLLLSPCGRSPSVTRLPQFKLREPEPNTELVVDRSGKVLLTLQPSGKPIWSVSTGSPIHSSYQSSAFVLEYVDSSAVDDHYATWKIHLTMEDLLKKTPFVTDDGVIQGSKTTSAYLVDAISGRLIQVYPSGDNSNINATSTGCFVKLPLLIKRTDSKIERFDKTTLKVTWNVTDSLFKAELLCDVALNSGDELGPEILDGIYMPLRCGSQTDVRALTLNEGAFGM